MTTDPWFPRLSEYLDDELTPAERLDVERHLLDCASCRAALDGLQRVLTDARALADDPPARDLWPDVRAALPMAAPARRISLSVPQALAAGILLAVVSGLCVALFLDRQRDLPHDAGATATARTDASPVAATAVSLTDPKYDHAIEDLTRLLAEERPHLNPKTLEALERSLATIDRAIAEARDALAKDPFDPFLNSHLAQQRRTKLELLRQANQLRSGL